MDDKDARIQGLARENDSLRVENSLLKQAMAEMAEEITALKAKIERLCRDSRTSSKPPSSDIVKPPSSGAPKTGEKRRPGGQPGHMKYERTPFTPEQVDKVTKHELTKKQARGLRPLNEWSVVQQIDLVERPFVVTEDRARKYLDPRTGRIVYAPMPPEIRRAGLIGPRLTAMIGFLKSKCHVSYSGIQTLLEDVCSIDLSRGQLASAVAKVSNALEAPYNELRDALRTQEHLGIDETGHPEAGKNLWAWCFRAREFTVFHVDPSRGSRVLQAVLTKAFGGVIGCDYFSAYRKYMKLAPVAVQFCMAHLIREIRFLAEHCDAVLARWGRKLLRCMKKLFGAIHRRERTTEEAYLRTMQTIRQRFLGIVRHPPCRGEARTLAQRFKGRGADCYFTFLTRPGVEPSNNLTEQALRPLVIDKRITQGTRTSVGRQWCERIWTAVATCAQQGRSVFDFLVDAIRAHLHRQHAPSLLPLKA